MRLALLLLVGCGTDAVPQVPGPDAPTDVAIPVGCDFVETRDATNDLTIVGGAVEPTGVVLQAAFTLCGSIDPGHFDSAASTVDLDAFAIDVGATTNVLVMLAGESTGLTSLELQRLDTTNSLRASGTVLGSHAAFETTLATGSHRFAVIAKGTADIPAAITYRLQVIPDEPDVRCARLATAAAYSETADGAQSNRNDVVSIRYAPNEKLLTAATNDAPEPTAIVTAAGTPVRITGEHADVDAPDDFKDRDAYLVETGAHDQLAVRLDWTGDADLDYFLFPEDSTLDIARGTGVGKLAPERATFPVLPNTRYWLWIGSYDSTTGLPVTYDATLCPAAI